MTTRVKCAKTFQIMSQNYKVNTFIPINYEQNYTIHLKLFNFNSTHYALHGLS
jgi:hypothetical protein